MGTPPLQDAFSIGGCKGYDKSLLNLVGLSDGKVISEGHKNKVYACSVSEYDKDQFENYNLDLNDLCAVDYHVCNGAVELDNFGITYDICSNLGNVDLDYGPKFYMTNQQDSIGNYLGCGTSLENIALYCRENSNSCRNQVNLEIIGREINSEGNGILNSKLNGDGFLSWTILNSEIKSFNNHNGGVMCCKDRGQNGLEYYIESVCESGKYLDCRSEQLFLRDFDDNPNSKHQRFRITEYWNPNPATQQSTENHYNIQCVNDAFHYGFINIFNNQFESGPVLPTYSLWRDTEPKAIEFKTLRENNKFTKVVLKIPGAPEYIRAEGGNSNNVNVVFDLQGRETPCDKWRLRPVRRI